MFPIDSERRPVLGGAMRYRLGFLVAIAIVGSVSVGAADAACPAAGEYRVTRPNGVGTLTLTETTSNPLYTGTVSLDLVPKRACPVCLSLIAVQSLTGHYTAGAGSDECVVVMTLSNSFDPAPEHVGTLGGRPAFGGSVIL